MTLVEILIGAAIMSIAAVGIYELFFSGAKTAALSMWRSKSETELKYTLRLVREDLGRASYPSVVSGSGTDIDRSRKCTIKAGRTQVSAGASGTLLDFYVCKPEVTVPGAEKAGEEIHCILSAENGKLRYSREGGANAMNRIVATDVDYVDISAEQAPDDAEKQIVTIEIGTVHPAFETTTVVQRTRAKVEVEVVGG